MASHGGGRTPGVQRSNWTGVLTGRRSLVAELSLQAPLQADNRGGSGAFLGLGSDGERYWIKTLNNLQGPRVPTTEQIVARAGSLIGAPACVVRTIEIPAALAGWEFRPGARLEAGVAHASLQVEPVAETRALDHRLEDDNARRHASILALHDWCWGGDGQWLVSMAEDNKFYSHDHGWYLPPSGPDWDIASMELYVDAGHELPAGEDGITPAIAREVAAPLRGVRRPDIADLLSRIPTVWPVTDQELECVGFFLERRAVPAAERLVSRFGGAP